MDFMIAAHSDTGIKKDTNQDALLIKVAQTVLGKVCLGVVCDGMGGLAEGELASATVIRAFGRWFDQDFPGLLAEGFSYERLRGQWDDLVRTQNQLLSQYGARGSIKTGTTVVALLIIDGHYYVMNVGDSRVYMLSSRLLLLTRDHTFIQYEMDQGRMTWAEAKDHPRRHVLMQCVGAVETVAADYYCGPAEPDTMFVLCSDGFRHEIYLEEMYEQLNPYALNDEISMKNHALYLTGLNKERRETDNISVVLVRTCLGG